MYGITSHITPSDIPVLDKIVQNVAMEGGRNLIIDTLREVFRRDRYYRWLPDIYGFGKAPSAIGLDLFAGAIDDTTTRIYIGGQYKNANAFLPAVVVRQTAMTYRPVSINQNKWDLEYGNVPIQDADGSISYISAPTSYSFVGLWDSNFEVMIVSKSLSDTSRLHDLIAISLQSTYRYILQNNGLFIKSISSSGEQVETTNANDPYYTSSISLSCLSQFRRRIPVDDMIHRIQLCVDFDAITTDTPPSTSFRQMIERDGEERIYFGAESFTLINESNISTLPFYLGVDGSGTYEINADLGEFAYFAVPEKFNVGNIPSTLTLVRNIVIRGTSYQIYRSNVPGIGLISFTLE